MGSPKYLRDRLEIHSKIYITCGKKTRKILTHWEIVFTVEEDSPYVFYEILIIILNLVSILESVT